MTTRHLVDPDLLSFVDAFPGLDLTVETLPLLRAGMAAQLAARPPVVDDRVRVDEVAIPSGEAGRTVRCLVVRPHEMAAGAAAILHFHGGGHVLGMPEMNLPQLVEWAAQLACLVVSVDYRLAPETPFPGPMDDAYAALRWLHESAADLGIDRSRIAVSGESAGGAMAACLCLMARDRGDYPVAFQHLEIPRLHDLLPDPPNAFAGEFVWTAANSAFCRAAYLGGSTSSYASAARATDLAGLPPTYIMVGALDLFVDECLDYAHRLIRAGVPVELIVYPGCFHGFRMAEGAPVSRRAAADNLRALERALKLPPR